MCDVIDVFELHSFNGYRENIEEVKCHFNTEMSEQEENLTELKMTLKVTVTTNNLKTKSWKQGIKIEEIKLSNESNHEELEQYDRLICLRIGSVPIKTIESSDDVLIIKYVKFLFKGAELDIPETVIDCVHRIGSSYKIFPQIKYNYTFFYIPSQNIVLQSQK